MACPRPLLLSALVLSACGPAEPGDTADTATAASTGAGPVTTGEPGETDEPPTGGETVRPNWHEDIAPLVAEHCQGCHLPGGVAPFAMMSYAETSPWAPAMAADVDMGLMPPWHAIETDECQPPFGFKHDARLSAEEKALFIDWANAGAPEGDPALAAEIPPPPSLDLADPSTTAKMQSSLEVPAAGTTRDYFHCLSIDPGNAETVYLDGLQVIAGNPSIVHHVLIYVDQNAASASWPGGIKKDCGGAAGGVPAQLIGAWVPGGLPIEPPDDVASELPAGTRLILNVHYHAAGAPQTDADTRVAMRWKTTAPAWSSLFQLIGAPGFGSSLDGPLMIPAGAKGHIEEYEWTVSYNGQPIPDLVDIRLWAALNHMHKVGVDMRVSIEDGKTGVETCLLQTPRYDYNWQRSYAYDTPIATGFRVRGGDKIRVRCTYDNTLDNPGVKSMLAEVGLDAPIDVGLGEGTLDEMCLTGLGVAVRGGL